MKSASSTAQSGARLRPTPLANTDLLIQNTDFHFHSTVYASEIGSRPPAFQRA